MRQQLSEHRALFLRSDLAVGPTLADRRESQDGTSPVHFLRLASPMLQVAAQARRPQLLKIEHLWQRFSAQHRRTMMDEQRYQRRDGALEHRQGVVQFGIQAARRIVQLPEIRQLLPGRLRIQRMTQGGA